jgi:hypothetical protein
VESIAEGNSTRKGVVDFRSFSPQRHRDPGGGEKECREGEDPERVELPPRHALLSHTSIGELASLFLSSSPSLLLFSPP